MYFILLSIRPSILYLDALIKNRIEKNCVIKKRFHFFHPFFTHIARSIAYKAHYVIISVALLIWHTPDNMLIVSCKASCTLYLSLTCELLLSMHYLGWTRGSATAAAAAAADEKQ